VAALRRSLPLGGEVPEDYVFEESSGQGDGGATVRLSQLFAPGKDSLIIYSYMFALQAEKPCASCTSILDGLDGVAPHVWQRANFAVIARAPLAKIQELARQRGWRNLRLLSSANNTFNRDYHAENEDGSQVPLLNVFVRRDGKIHHFYTSELLWAPQEPGQDGRHVDMVWPLWHLFDLTPEGRGATHHPRLAYDQ
jgi:predicted dithiol-disulfide oxidoreductase (DUF899 family)